MLQMLSKINEKRNQITKKRLLSICFDYAFAVCNFNGKYSFFLDSSLTSIIAHETCVRRDTGSFH